MGDGRVTVSHSHGTLDWMLGELSQFQGRLLAWYESYRRDLPWRVSRRAQAGDRPDPYHVLVSEAMLQQTQVATVVPYFLRFIERFPTLASLAAADEQEVLRHWQGLGYYSRASRLRGTAKIVVQQYGGQLPSTVEDLLKLPGIGRYTAGAIASLAFEQRAPIVDGNVIRVLCRLDKVEQDPRSSAAAREGLWRRAEDVLPQRRVGDFNSALMELGATVCTPRAPQCLLCPVQGHCAAFAAGIQERIPPTAMAKERPIERRWVVCIGDGKRWLMEQRPAKGRWAGMWQFVTLVAGRGSPTAEQVRERTGLGVKALRRIGAVKHELTHRRYHFSVFACEAEKRGGRCGEGRVWVELEGLSDYPLPKPHLQVAGLLREMRG